ncbi:MAG: GNAT family N-acetyltransferase [Thermoplasmatota archaeon]
MRTRMLEVRRAVQEDVPSIAVMWRAFMREQRRIARAGSRGARSGGVLAPGAEAAFTRFVSSLVDSRRGLVLVAEVDGRPAGYCVAAIRRNIPVFRLRNYGLITDLYVDRRHRGRGLSSLMRTEVLRWLRRRGVAQLRLNVLIGNARAIAVYRRWGMVPYMTEMRMRV